MGGTPATSPEAAAALGLLLLPRLLTRSRQTALPRTATLCATQSWRLARLRGDAAPRFGTAEAAAAAGLAGAVGPAETPEELEAQLHAAVAAEEFTEAARLRDALQQLMMDGEAAVLCANREFYAAFQTCDAKRMAAIWLDGGHSCCLHPGQPPINGGPEVVASWEGILRGQRKIDIECIKPCVVVRGNIGRLLCYERVSGGVTLAAVNLFESTTTGWKMWYHQAGMVNPRLLDL